jgi:hypothetical protein
VKPQGHIPPTASPSAHEQADLDVPLIVKVAVILGSTLVLLIVAVILLFDHFDKAYPNRTSEAAPVVTDAELPPAPRLQTDPARDLQAVRAKEDEHLIQYAWVDRRNGLAQIPIERAMALWVAAYSAAAPNPATAPATNAAPAPTELQIRQQKAQEASHAP